MGDSTEQDVKETGDSTEQDVRESSKFIYRASSTPMGSQDIPDGGEKPVASEIKVEGLYLFVLSTFCHLKNITS
jgi:hypothetical protein